MDDVEKVARAIWMASRPINPAGILNWDAMLDEYKEQWRVYARAALSALGGWNVRSEVAAFALLMERELRANEHKCGWKQDAPDVLARRVTEEARELQEVADEATIHSPVPKDVAGRIAEEAADVANMAMMVADVCGCLTGITVALGGWNEAIEALKWYAGECDGGPFYIVDKNGERVADFSLFTSRAKAALEALRRPAAEGEG